MQTARLRLFVSCLSALYLFAFSFVEARTVRCESTFIRRATRVNGCAGDTAAAPHVNDLRERIAIVLVERSAALCILLIEASHVVSITILVLFFPRRLVKVSLVHSKATLSVARLRVVQPVVDGLVRCPWLRCHWFQPLERRGRMPHGRRIPLWPALVGVQSTACTAAGDQSTVSLSLLHLIC